MDFTLETPSYISSRSANSLISFSRPTRIQAITLDNLNKILDELLLLILTSAKSLATDRIKSDGILKVLGGQSGSGSGAGALLAKNAVLEAELELRSYLEGQRKEGGKMPLGLSATSRWDGTEGFPVQSAYKTLRIRCQYYSTLGELEDPSPNTQQEQNIMSTDGRPIATITPGVAIYVTALLEFVAEYILQNVARVIERDNSDEAALGDLIKAMEEDEGTSYWWNKTDSKKHIQSLDKENKHKGGKVQKPWQVPDANEYDQAAGRKKYNRQSLNALPSATSSNNINNASTVSSPLHDRTFSSGQLHDLRNAGATSPTFSHQTHTTGMTSVPSGSTEGNTLKRRPSTDKGGWFGRRRGSFRSSQDLGFNGFGSNGEKLIPGSALTSRDTDNSLPTTDSGVVNGEGGDFDFLVMSGQTMKVSLTPNRLRSMDASADGDLDGEKNNRSARKRPGTGTLLRAETPSSFATRVASPTNLTADGQTDEKGDLPPRPGSRAGSTKAAITRGQNKGAPPSAYRGPDSDAQNISENPETETSSNGFHDNQRSKGLSAREKSEVSAPPSPMTDSSYVHGNATGRESRMSLASQASTDTNKRLTLSGAGGKVLSLFGRRSNTNTGSSPNSPATSTNVSVDPALTRSYSSSTYRSARVPGGTRTNGEENFTDSRSVTPSGTIDRKDANSTPSGTVSGDKESFSHHSRKSLSPDLQRTNGNSIVASGSNKTGESIREERRESVSKFDERPTTEDDNLHVNNNTGNSQSTGLVGIYQEPRANASASTLSSAHNRDVAGAQNSTRKVVPWSYNRRRSSGPLINAANRVGSGGSSGHGHSDLGATTNAAPPSAWSQNNFDASGSAGSSGHGISANAGNTPTIGVSPTFGRTSPSPRPFSMTSKTDTARLLVQLNQRMRECNSVEECQRLITQALALTAAAVHSEHDSPTATNVQTSTSDSMPTSTLREQSNTATVTDPERELLNNVPIYKPVNYRNLALPMAIGYDPAEDDNLPLFKKQSLVAAWLLDNDGDEPQLHEISAQEGKEVEPLPRTPSITANRKSSRRSSFASPGIGNYKRGAISRQNSVSSAGQESEFASADERPRQSMFSANSHATESHQDIPADFIPTGQGMLLQAATNGKRKPVPALPISNGKNGQTNAIQTRNTSMYEMPSAADSGTAAGFIDDEEANRVSLVSSTHSTYRDAEEGSETVM